MTIVGPDTPPIFPCSTGSEWSVRKIQKGPRFRGPLIIFDWSGQPDSVFSWLRRFSKLLILQYSRSSESSEKGRDAHVLPTRTHRSLRRKRHENSAFVVAHNRKSTGYDGSEYPRRIRRNLPRLGKQRKGARPSPHPCSNPILGHDWGHLTAVSATRLQTRTAL
jgi:hypothetical protein